MAGLVDFLGRAFGTVVNPVVVTVSSGGGLGGLTPLGDAQGSVTSAAQTLAAVIGISIPTGATIVALDVEGGSVRFRTDGVNPTSTVGRRLGQNASMEYDGDLTKLKFILESGTPKINVSFF